MLTPHRTPPAEQPAPATQGKAAAARAPRQPLAKQPTPPQRQDTTVAKLARFHGNAQTFSDTARAIEGLADALNIPPGIAAQDIPRALRLAHDNSAALRPYLGQFPIPADTAPRLLVALTPSDIPLLAQLIRHAATIPKPRFTLTANLASGDLRFETRVHALPARGDTACFRHAMTFIRRSFRHALHATACRQGERWFLSPSNDRRTQ